MPARRRFPQPPEESCEFRWGGVDFSTAYFDRRADGTSAPKGRWSDWVFPADSFGEVRGLLDGIPVPAMSVAGMLAMKEQFPILRNGWPWRDKDMCDLAVLRDLRSGPLYVLKAAQRGPLAPPTRRPAGPLADASMPTGQTVGSVGWR
jgi:hypothetical protein